MDREESFTMKVKLDRINPYVDVPEHVVEALGNGTKVPVLVKIAAAERVEAKAHPSRKRHRLETDAARLETIGRLDLEGWFRTTLVPRQSELPRLYLDTTYLNFLKMPEALERNVQKTIARLLKS